MEEIIKELKEKYILVILSDHVKEWINYIKEKNSIFKYFNKMYFSFNIGTIKSEKETFEYVINDLKLSSDEILFIDDSINNIKIAKSININSVLFKNSDSLRQELKLINIL